MLVNILLYFFSLFEYIFLLTCIDSIIIQYRLYNIVETTCNETTCGFPAIHQYKTY